MKKKVEKNTPERLDKILAKAAALSRRDAKRAALAGRITVNGIVTCNPDQKVEPDSQICLDGKELSYNRHVYILLNKPSGYVCANDDPKSPNVFELLGSKYKKNGLFTVGRLDKNTTGLLLITDNGSLAHYLLSPKRHVEKKYYLQSKFPLTQEDREAFLQGVDIGEKRLTKSAVLEICKEAHYAFLTITEGKFHQIKRMLEARSNKVVALQRVAFGPLSLDDSLACGQYRTLSESEINRLLEVPEN